jgi:hypothetical protein
MKGKDRADSVLEKPGTGLVIYIMLYLIGVMLFSLSVFWIGFPKDSFPQNMQILGIGLWLIAIVLGGYHGCKWLYEKYQDSKIRYDEDGYRIWTKPEEKQPSIITEFVKAKYNKYCPKIDWE